jgi:hypothetical protein
MAHKKKQSNSLREHWKSFIDRNKRYEQLNDRQKELWQMEDIAIAEHNARLLERALRRRQE